jgi:acyl-coenzyme A thioesterase PaaI-like protein
VHPTITVLRPGDCEVHAPNRRSSHDHLGTYHAIASCNLAELAAGMMSDATIPSTHRWIPVAMSVEYPAKASTDTKATAIPDPLPEIGEEPSTLTVPVAVTSADGTVAVKAQITIHVSRKRRQHIGG